MKTGRVAGKVALVTGTASAAGLGFATARALAREGAAVVLTDIDEAAVLDRAKELAAAGWTAVGARQDVTVEEDWCRSIGLAVERFGKLDILVNNAGITLRGPVHEMTLETWSRVMEINLTGSFLGCKHAVAAMRRQQSGGALVNVASIAGLIGTAYSAAYASSKGGLRQLSKVVAIEGAKEGIRCNSVYPGLIMSDIHEAIIRNTPEQHKSFVESIPMGRMGEPDDIAFAILYLASDEAKYVTGAEIVIDGGFTAM